MPLSSLPSHPPEPLLSPGSTDLPPSLQITLHFLELHVNGVTQDASFSNFAHGARVFSCLPVVRSSRLSPSVPVISQGTAVLSFICQLICWWTFGLFPGDGGEK